MKETIYRVAWNRIPSTGITEEISWLSIRRGEEYLVDLMHSVNIKLRKHFKF